MMPVQNRSVAAVLFACLLSLPVNSVAIETDVCVYGGTSGGVVAAVQAARMGKRVVLVEPGRHLGGMTSGGLSAVDIGDPRSIGGITREYFTRLVATYGKELNWGKAFEGKGGPATGGAYSIEPHVAEGLFDQMAKEAGVVVLREARLKAVHKEGARIVEITTDDGRSIRAKMFIDATYEGDLMANAGVTFTLMREGNAKYGEQYNGIHYTDKYKPRTGHRQPGVNGRLPGGQGVWDRDFPLDPYVVKGDPSSGLLPLLNEGEPGTHGEPAPGVMAYCFRLCLTTDTTNMIPITSPADYDARRYELVARFIEACVANGDDMDLRWFSKHDPLPNSKWDFNTATFGGNLPGASWEWPEASYDRRVDIATEIENYHRGLLHFLATDSRVPLNVRNDVKRFGLPKDEFTDNGGWPHQVYIREGRRLVSDLVLTEHHTFGRTIAPHCIGLGSYGTDVHEIRRIVKDGVVTREGKVAGGRGGFGPYDIGYGAIVPKQTECENLFVTFALSASHTAFASIRMEPVLMVTSQSAATAACLAIDAGVLVQQVNCEQLQARLIADDQVLTWKFGKQNAAPREVTMAQDLPGIAMDDTQALITGDWIQSSGQPSLIGLSYHHDGNTGRGQKSATFTPSIPESGRYEVRLLYTWHANRSNPQLRGQRVSDAQFPNDALIDGVIQFIHGERTAPCFLYLSQYFVHDPVHTRCEWLIDKYRKRLPKNTPELQVAYCAMIETLDHLIGRVLDAIETAGQRDHTMIVLTSDNGAHPNYTSNAPLRGSKWNLYEGGIRVPMIVRWPGHVQPGSTCSTPVFGCDLLPTFCDVAALDISREDLDGESLRPLLTEEPSGFNRQHPLYWHFPYYHPEKRFSKSPREIGIGDFATSQTRPHSAIRDGDWKLLTFYENDDVELYNLKNDIGEQNDVQEIHSEIAARLKLQLMKERNRVNARFPGKRLSETNSPEQK